MKLSQAIIDFVTKEAKGTTIGYVHYNDKIEGGYKELRNYIHGDDDRYDFYEDEKRATDEIFEDVVRKFPELEQDLLDMKSNEEEQMKDEILTIVQDNAKYEDIRLGVVKNTGNAWINIELPYYHDGYRAIEAIEDKQYKEIKEYEKMNGVFVDDLEEADFDALYAKNGWKDRKESDRYAFVIEYCFKKMGIKDASEFAKKMVEGIEYYINLAYSPLYYDYPLAFYTKIDLRDYLNIVRNPGKEFNIVLPDACGFGITNDGGACTDTGRVLSVKVTCVDPADHFLSICDGSEKAENRLHAHTATLDDFYGDDLCGLCHDAHGFASVKEA